jgi:ribonuclease HIII
MTLQLNPDQREKLKQFLEKKEFIFEERPHQEFLARGDNIVVNLYTSGKVVFGGGNKTAIKEIEEYLKSLGSEDVKKTKKEYPPIEVSGTRIGTDEVGKGDYFGPLVIAGALINEKKEKELAKVGIRDSKTLSETTISNMATKIRRILTKEEYEVVWISPLKYNLLHKKLRNLNRILGWGHARAIENLLGNGKDCKVAIADQFGDESYIESVLTKKGIKIDLTQVPKAERDLAVATASVLARDKFIYKLREMGDSYSVIFPKGSSNVIEFGKQFISDYGIDVLPNIAKIHFSSITQEITGGPLPEIKEEVKTNLEVEPREPTEKDIAEARLECYNLITAFEKELRGFIDKELKKHYGEEWWEKGVNKDIRGKCERLKRVEQSKGRKVRAIDCLDFSHYAFILADRNNWPNIFSKILENKEEV